MTPTFTIDHGIGGLWEVFRWNSSYVFNTQPGPNRVLVERISGLHALPDLDDQRAPRVGRIGENAYPSSPNGITRTIEGILQYESLALLRLARTEFLAAFADTRTEKTLELVPQTSYDGSPTPYFLAKVLACEVGPEENTSYQFTRPFILSLRSSDPRIYYPEWAVDETGAGSVSVTNEGTAPVEPTVQITVATPGDITIGDGTHSLTFLDVPAGTLLVSFGARTAQVGTTNVALDVPNSTWWDSHVDGLAGGATKTFSQTGGTDIEVSFTPATWG